MSYDEATAGRVRRLLSARADVTEVRMMGGLCFMAGGNMCCGVTGTSLMVRVGPEAAEVVRTQPHVRPMQVAGRTMAAFVRVDPEGFATDTALGTWVDRGLLFVSTLPPKPGPKAQRR